MIPVMPTKGGGGNRPPSPVYVPPEPEYQPPANLQNLSTNLQNRFTNLLLITMMEDGEELVLWIVILRMDLT